MGQGSSKPQVVLRALLGPLVHWQMANARHEDDL